MDILDKLIRMEVVKKESPINDEGNKKKAGYFVSDNLSLFYYKYIFRNISRMNVMDSEVFYDKYIAKDFESYHVPKCFEDICRQYLVRLNRKGKTDEIFEKIGKELGQIALNNFHAHIAGIEYGAKGEKKHLNLEESDFNYKDLLKAFKTFDVKGAVVCESPNIEDDAKLLKDYYLSL